MVWPLEFGIFPSFILFPFKSFSETTAKYLSGKKQTKHNSGDRYLEATRFPSFQQSFHFQLPLLRLKFHEKRRKLVLNVVVLIFDNELFKA